MRYLVSSMLIVAGVIHVIPLIGIIGRKQLSEMYGVAIDDSSLEILMRHRAVLFGLVGSFLIFAAFKTNYQFLAFVTGFVSVVSFIYLSFAAGSYNTQIGRVVFIDVIALICLIIGAGAYYFETHK